MAYGKHYFFRFKNRVSNDIYRAEIWQSGFSGAVTELRGAETPLTIAYQDNDILTPVKAIEITLNFFVDGTVLNLETFYNDNDEAFRVDIYCETPADKLLYSGFIIQDGTSEPETDRQHILTLKATDNLALLKNISWKDATPQYNGKFPLAYFIRYCLKQTGLYSPDSVIDQSLPLRLYGNVFENTEQDRGNNILNDPFQQIFISSSIFLNSDSTWQDCYTVLTKILTDYNACLLQGAGAWNVVRPGEYKYFAGLIPGNEYVYNGTGTNVNAVTLNNNAVIARSGADLYPTSEDLNKAIVRPLQSLTDTFNYNNPASYIRQSDLILPAGAVPFYTNTSGGIKTDRYNLATYFPAWIARGNMTEYLEIITDITTGNETDRYIAITGDATATVKGGLEFNPIEISAGDVIEFSAQVKNITTTADNMAFYTRPRLIDATGAVYCLARNEANSGGVIVASARWFGPYPGNEWDSITDFTATADSEFSYNGTSLQWAQIADNNYIDFIKDHLPPCPVDGVLLYRIKGTNYEPLPSGAIDPNTPRVDTAIKSFKIDIQNNINNSASLTGQKHTETFNPNIKAVQTNDKNFDDSPRNTIAGTLFTDKLSNFDYTDINTGAATGIGSLYFTRTLFWHTGHNNESLRVGNIIARERLQLLYTARYSREGTFRLIRFQTNDFTSLLTLFSFSWLPGRNFLARGLTIDFMNNTVNGRLQEIFKTDESDFLDKYIFSYVYKTQ
jgi:hypothetical protein